MNYKKACGKSVTLEEREYLKTRASRVTKGFIVNIGVFRGATMYCLRAGAPKARLLGIDIEPSDTPVEDLNAEFIWEDSRTCHVQVTDPIDLLFIDGDHHYAVVKEDIKNWTPKVCVDGVVVFHDCYPLPKDLRSIPHLVGVNKAVSEWYAANREEWREIEAADSLRAFKRFAAVVGAAK